ncbi:MAG TPA: hypothetical protein VHS09_06690 [Polyangiaceae bacterium]|jgi:hypothetical protein|nr:hypothetical protein [Polyangiaceae bacterium]
MRWGHALALVLWTGGALACGSSSGSGTGAGGEKLGVGAACNCAGDEAGAGTDTLCGGAMYTACDPTLALYCVDGVCATVCNAGQCAAGYVCKDLPHSNQTYCAPAAADGG